MSRLEQTGEWSEVFKEAVKSGEEVSLTELKGLMDYGGTGEKSNNNIDLTGCCEDKMRIGSLVTVLSKRGGDKNPGDGQTLGGRWVNAAAKWAFSDLPS